MARRSRADRIIRRVWWDDTIGARLEVGVDVVNVWRDVGISGKALHDRRSTALAVVHDTPEGFNIREVVDQRRAKR
jgi:hypothetical protein